MSKGNSTAVLIVDAQLCAFDGVRSPPCYDASVLLDNLVLLTKSARENSVPVIFIQHCGLPSQLYAEGSDQWKIHPAISPATNEIVIRKTQSNSFDGTELEQVLLKLEVETVIVCGLQSEFCVNNTCMGALNLGFNVAVISDTHSTWSNNALQADEIIAQQNRLLETNGITCRTLREIFLN
jgi:nicotinamidase-related amidase